jgi:glycine hydroxymethyltransferase
VLDRAGITLNKNTVPDDPRARSSPAAAHRHAVGHHAGHGEPEMAQIAELIARVLRHRTDAAELAARRSLLRLVVSA